MPAPPDSFLTSGLVNLAPLSIAASDMATPAANAAGTITLAAQAGFAHVIYGLYWSYAGATVTGNLIIQDGGVTVFSVDISAAGPGQLTFGRPIRLTPGNVGTVTLAAGGSGVTGKLNVSHALQQTA